MKVVLDTNVVVSGFLSANGAPRQILLRIERGLDVAVASPALLDELRHVLSRHHIASRLNGVAGDALAAWFGSHAQVVEPVSRDAHEGLRDPDDLLVIACVVSAQPDYLISGDDDLVALKDVEGVPVVTPSDYLGLFKGGPGDGR